MKNKQYLNNMKNPRFINAVNSFKSKQMDQTQNIRVMILGSGNILGEEDIIKERCYSTSVQCFSQTGELYCISLEDFHKFIKNTDMETWMMLERNALQKELGVLKIMESKHNYEQESKVLKADYPNKYLDVELSYMKEIRETYFKPKEEDFVVELPKVISKNELYSITDQSVRYNSNITPLKRVNMNLKKDHGSLSPRREQAYKSQGIAKKTIEFDLGAMFKTGSEVKKESRLDSPKKA